MSGKALALYDTTIGKKAVMAVSGIVLVGFVVGHMVGNLQIFAGDGGAKLDAYAHLLQSLGGALWLVRLVLLGAVVAHAWSAISLVAQNKAARPIKYHVKQDPATTYAAKAMFHGGLLVALFIVFHILHLTVGVTDAGFVHGKVYANVISGFSNPAVAGFYVLANLALGLHLFHGVWSLMQSLGLSHPRYDHFRKYLASAIAIAVTIGNVSIPVAVLSGLIS